MLDIIGNIKIDESKPERVDYFIACLKSWAFFKEHCKIYLNLNLASDDLKRKIKRVFEECGYSGGVYNVTYENYGKAYSYLLQLAKNPFVLNFIEDHFMLIDDKEKMLGILEEMKLSNVDVLKTSFFRIEQNSQHTLKHAVVSPYGKIFRMNAENHIEYGRHYGSRYFLGVNFLTTRDFALKFWNRDMGHRPHEYEIDVYKPEWEHICMIPSMEIQCAVDDDHGEENTCLLKRNEEKWERIISVKVEKLESVKVEQPNETIIVSPTVSSSSSVSERIENRIEESPKQEPLSVIRQYSESELIPLNKFPFNNLKAENDLYDDGITRRICRVMASGNYLLGEQCEELEERFAKFIGKKYCIAVKNCTDALMMTVKYLLRERPNATVIVPNFGAYSTAIAVKNCTDNIHFVDVDESLTIDVTKLPDIKNGIIIPVHLFGNHANMKAIRRYSVANGHLIIEDCAQSCGSGSGQVGEFSCFSFYPTKPLGTMGDGGAICTNNKIAYEELLAMRNHGIPASSSTLGVGVAGINSRMGELECAVVNAKLGTFEQFFEKRRMIASRYKKIISGIRINSNCIYHQFTVLFNEREKIIAELTAREIPFMIHYPQHISEMPVFSVEKVEKLESVKVQEHGSQLSQPSKPSNFPTDVGFRVNDKIISLPCHPFMQEEHIQKVEEFLTEYKSYEY